MNAHHTFTAAATSASSLSTSWLIDASKAARAAEEARANGDHSLADLYDQQAKRAYEQADRKADDVRWYRARAEMLAVKLTYPKIETQRLEAAE